MILEEFDSGARKKKAQNLAGSATRDHENPEKRWLLCIGFQHGRKFRENFISTSGYSEIPKYVGAATPVAKIFQATQVVDFRIWETADSLSKRG